MEIFPDFLLTPYQLIADPRVTPLEERVYSVVYWFRSMRLQKCTAANETIAQLAKSKSATAVQNALTNLEKLGYIRRTYKDSARRVRDEIIPLVTFARLSSVGDTVSPAGDTQVSPTGDQMYNNTNDKTKPKSAALYSDPGFNKFWAEYPRREAKGAAWKAWLKIAPTQAVAEAIIAGVVAHKLGHENWKVDPVTKKPREKGRFIPHPSTFLNERRWEDCDTAEPKPSKYGGVRVTKA